MRIHRPVVATLLTLGIVMGAGTVAPATAATESAPGRNIAASLTTASSTPTLVIKAFTFSAIKVKRGTKFKVRNMDGADHTIKIAGTKTDALVAAGKTITLTAPIKAGKYKLSCDFHLTMHGTLTVTN